ncbi:hypothetical protein ACIA5G_14085 [Amycolatopsis sp. NPDC051758]|uniref:hypothetical protein n=1 Tax=Amycolatopsis sp. NPDC051758 TaxID=3363935 RepID=UPI00379B1176
MLAAVYVGAGATRDELDAAARDELVRSGRAETFVPTSQGVLHVRLSGPADSRPVAGDWIFRVAGPSQVLGMIADAYPPGPARDEMVAVNNIGLLLSRGAGDAP